MGYIVDKTVRGNSTVTAKKRRLPQKIDLDILRLAKQISNFMKRIEQSRVSYSRYFKLATQLSFYTAPTPGDLWMNDRKYRGDYDFREHRNMDGL